MRRDSRDDHQRALRLQFSPTRRDHKRLARGKCKNFQKFFEGPVPLRIDLSARASNPRAARCTLSIPGRGAAFSRPDIAPRGATSVRFALPRASPPPVEREPCGRTVADEKRAATSPPKARPTGRFPRRFKGFCKGPIHAATNRRGHGRRERGLTFGATPWPAMENGGVARRPHHRPQTVRRSRWSKSRARGAMTWRKPFGVDRRVSRRARDGRSDGVFPGRCRKISFDRMQQACRIWSRKEVTFYGKET